MSILNSILWYSETDRLEWFIMLHFWIIFAFFGHVMCIDRNWWKYTEIYEIYIASFKDSDGDGIGDFNGITSKIDHFHNLKIGSIWITPFYESPLCDMGYDISNFTAIHPKFGTMEDFEELSKEAKKRGTYCPTTLSWHLEFCFVCPMVIYTPILSLYTGIKIIIDFVINHSSDEHIWFQKSVAKIKPYDKFYVWRDPKGYSSHGEPIPPNNWMSIFGGSTWQWNDERKQFYYHAFSKKQPDFNLGCKELKQEIKNVIKFWFDKGVSGLRMDAVSFYMEDKLLRDENLLNPNIEKENYTRLDFDLKHTYNLPENIEVLHELRLFVDEINKKKGGSERIMVVEDHSNTEMLMKYYGSEKYPVAHFPFNFLFVHSSKYFTSRELHENITEWLKNMPKHGVANWLAENHDDIRIGGRYVREYIHIMNFLIMMLPGIACLYFGQEIGMVGGLVRPNQRLDLYIDPISSQTRDWSRTPMQWDNSMNAGFTTKHMPWLPVHPNYWSQNVESQKKSNYSYYNIFKELSSLRKTKTCKYGAFNSYVLSTWIYAFTRVLKGSETFVVVMNLGTEMEIVNLSGGIPNLGNTLEVLVASDNAGYKKGDMVKGNSIFPHLFIMRPISVIVLASKIPHKGDVLDSIYIEPIGSS